MKLNLRDRNRHLHKARLLNTAVVTPLAPLLIGGIALALAPQTMAGAEAIPNDILVAQGLLQTPAPPPPTPTLQQNNSPELLAQRRNSSRNRNRNTNRNRKRRVQCESRQCDYQSYVVYIPRYNDSLLEQVQSIVPEATKMRYGSRDVIQVGAYSEEGEAEDTRTYLREQGFSAEMGSILTRRTSQFSVIVSNRYLLDIVQEEASNATLGVDKRSGQKVIVAGQYSSASRAQELVNELRERGILAEIVGDVSVLDTTEFTNDASTIEVTGDNYQTQSRVQLVANNNQSRSNSLASNYYGVMISCRETDLDLIEAQVRRMAPSLATERGIYQIENANEPFVMVGPFADRKTAERWQRYLKDFGLSNAQVFYGS
ncbi:MULTISPECIES: hypothetical protein [Aerosakkonema]|uniref:hypothetical protein n=1 Tax=Aerosakkonema TaxID=1246629 RepID=UPI0035B78AB6